MPSVLTCGHRVPSQPDKRSKCSPPQLEQAVYDRVCSPPTSGTVLDYSRSVAVEISTVSGLRALPLLLIATLGSTSAFGSPESGERSTTRLTCFVVRAGDTVARLAERYTGNRDNRRRSWFQIVDPATSTVIPKSRYDEIEPGWQVCVASEMLKRGLAQPQYLPVSTAGVVAPQSNVVKQAPVVQAIDLSPLWLAAPLFVAASGVGFAWGWRRIEERRASLNVLRAFGERFIFEFERPLRRNATSPPVRSRVRFAPSRRRVDILIAPAGGRTYPNLIDHRRNVEYDVDRVMRALRDPAFVTDSLYAQGPWVVVPCRFETDRQQEGGL